MINSVIAGLFLLHLELSYLLLMRQPHGFFVCARPLGRAADFFHIYINFLVFKVVK